MSKLHIHSPKSKYIAQLKMRGYRTWETISKEEFETPEYALLFLSKAITTPIFKSHKRGRILMIDNDGWYEPVVIIEINRRDK